MPTQCPSCKAINRDNAQFCDSCGSKLISSAPQPSTLPDKPDSLPSTGTYSPPKSPPPSSYPEIQIPKIRSGASFGSWITYLILLFVVGIFLFGAILLETIFDYHGAGTAEFVITYIVLLVITMPIFRSMTNSIGYFGTVTHLRSWSPYNQPQQPNTKKPTPNWVFNLQKTNKKWQPLKDKKGFLEPVVEIAYRVEKLHGPPLEEGCRVAVRGKKKKNKVIVKEIWNLGAPTAISSTSDQESVFYGRVTNWTHPSQAADMRFPGENRHLEVWNFRLQYTDPDFQSLLRDATGSLSDPIPVLIKAQSISGPISDGDKLEIHGQVSNNTLHPIKIINHSAGNATITIRGRTTSG